MNEEVNTGRLTYNSETSELTQIPVWDNNISYYDSSSYSGLTYSADYSANYTNRNLNYIDRYTISELAQIPICDNNISYYDSYNSSSYSVRSTLDLNYLDRYTISGTNVNYCNSITWQNSYNPYNINVQELTYEEKRNRGLIPDYRPRSKRY